MQFRFDAPQVSDDGPANFLIFNMGGSFTGSFLQSHTSLYADSVLLRTVDSTYANAYFTSQTGLYVFGDLVDAAGFSSILDGTALATLLFTPTFADPAGYVTLSGWAPHAGTSTGPESLTDIFPAPAVTAEVVPEPATIALVGAALFAVAATRRLRLASS